MGIFLTSPALTEQLPIKGLYSVCSNELYKDDDNSIYLVWRGFQTDNFTWINSNDWDIRCSHGHDVGCKYHQVVKVNLTVEQLYSLNFLKSINNKIICFDIPENYLEIVNISGNWINNLFYRMLKSADCPKTPKFIQIFYRVGVAFNLNWFKSGKKKIDLSKIYIEEWNSGK